ncbi:MAG: DUF4118 domain-containing protein, partial [Acidimicrobiales bacterium]
MRRSLVGSGAALGTMAVLVGGLLPLRGHLSVATIALVLVVPVVTGVVAGGFGAGVVAVVAGFLVYDILFIPPYGTLTVGRSQNWVALGVYAVVMLLVARVVAELDSARTEAYRREEHIRRLFEMSELLVHDKGLPELLELVVNTVRDAFGLTSVALLLPGGEALELVASAGDRFTDEELR